MDSKTTLNKTFCIQPFLNVTTRISGQHNVCCNISKLTKSNTKCSPKEFFNSDYVKEMKQTLLEGKKWQDCSLCYYMEEQGQVSHREHYNRYYYLNNPYNYETDLKKLKFDKLKNPKYYEIHIGNLCNLKCLTCNENDSSKFHAENKLLNISKQPNKDFSVFLNSKKKHIYDAITDDLQFLDIRGGETLLVPEIKNVLKELSVDKTKKITLKIQTNGTIIPDNDWLDIFCKFKNTKVNVSIDAYNNDNYYIRFPSNWQNICKTIEVLKNNNIKFVINTVLSNLNLLRLPELLEWISKNNYLNYLYILKDPHYFRYTNLPQKLIDKAAVELEKISFTFANKDTNIVLNNLISTLKQKHDNYEKHWEQFKETIIMRDKIRNNSIFSILPEMKEFF